MQKWTISRSRSRDGKGWHVQARTDDQFTSFAVVIRKGTNYLRTIAENGKDEVFIVVQMEPHVTFNVLGKIKYEGDWEGV